MMKVLAAFIALTASTCAQLNCTWSPLGAGLDGMVLDMTVFDDGTGPALYAGGGFNSSGSTSMARIGRWDGTSWSALGSGISGSFPSSGAVRALAVFDDGTGPALYVGGSFQSAGGMAAESIARWDGTNWSPLGSGLAPLGLFTGVWAMEVYDDGTGPALYVGGSFSTAGGVPALGIARWDGTSWSALGGGISGEVKALEVFDDGTGPSLWVGGFFGAAGAQPAANIARWDGASWSVPPGSISQWVGALRVHDDGTGPALYVGGVIQIIGPVLMHDIVRWNGMFWSSVGTGTGGSPLHSVRAMTEFDDGRGPSLWIGGEFLMAGGAPANELTSWNGSFSSPLPGITPHGSVWIEDLEVFDPGTGPRLYAGGIWPSAGGLPAPNIASMTSCLPASQPISLPTIGFQQQGGPGSGLIVQNSLLDPGDEYFNLFSTEPCPGFPGGGPLFGLCAPTPAGLAFLVSQAMMPVGAAPFHYIAPTTVATFGPFSVPPTVLEAVTLHFRNGFLLNHSGVARVVVQ